MSESTKRLLVDLGLGLAIAIAASFWLGLYEAVSLPDVFRILSDCFFLSAVIMLASGGLTWTKNGGVWDGFGYSFKIAMMRVRKTYEEDRITFAEYREQRESKITSPASALISGAAYLVIALAFLAIYNMVI